MAFTYTQSLASEQSRDITLKALLPWFKIQTLTQTITPTHTPNHTITQNPNPIPSPNQTYREMKPFFPRSGENWSRDHQKAASKNEKYVGICLQISKILKSEKSLASELVRAFISGGCNMNNCQKLFLTSYIRHFWSAIFPDPWLGSLYCLLFMQYAR